MTFKPKACRRQVLAELRALPPVPFDPEGIVLGRDAVKLAWLRAKCRACRACPDMAQ